MVVVVVAVRATLAGWFRVRWRGGAAARLKSRREARVVIVGDVHLRSRSGAPPSGTQQTCTGLVQIVVNLGPPCGTRGTLAAARRG